MADAQLSDLNICQLSDLLSSLGLNKLKNILVENEISGAVLSEISSFEELQSIDSSVKTFEAKGWFKEICKLKERLPALVSHECPVCYRLYSEVDPTTLPCDHSLCIEDAKKLNKCPTCDDAILEGFKFPVNFTMRNFVLPVQRLADLQSVSTVVVTKELINSYNSDLQSEPLNGGAVVDNGQVSSDSDPQVEEVRVTVGNVISISNSEKYDNGSCAKDDNSNNNNESDSDAEPSSITLKSSGKKKKKRVNNRKKVDELAVDYEQATYYCNEKAFQRLLAATKAGNVYAVGYVELWHMEMRCFNQYFDESAVRRCFEVLTALGHQNDKRALFIIATHMRLELLLKGLDRRAMLPAQRRPYFDSLKKSVDLGFTLALPELADCYLLGIGVDEDIQKSVEMHNHAISLGHFYSHVRLSSMPGASRDYLKTAADCGVVQAQFTLGLLLRESLGHDSKLYIRAAAESGYPAAMMHIGEQEKGNSAIALEWFMKAARNGFENALMRVIYHLENLLHNGIHEECPITADDLYFYELWAKMTRNSASVAIWAAALQNLGRNEEAFALYKEEADKHNDVIALRCTAEFYKSGIGGEKSLAEARRYFEKAVELGDSESMMALGDFYENGTGVDVDLDKALEYYKLAHKNGDKHATNYIKCIIEAKLKCT